MRRKTRKRIRKDMNLLTRLIMLVLMSAPLWAMYCLRTSEALTLGGELLLAIVLIFGFVYDIALMGVRLGLTGF